MKQQITDFTKHLRVIHLTLSAASISLLYLGLMASSEVPALLVELDMLKNIASSADKLARDPTSEAAAQLFQEVHPEWFWEYSKNLDEDWKSLGNLRIPMSVLPGAVSVIRVSPPLSVPIESLNIGELANWLSTFSVYSKRLSSPLGQHQQLQSDRSGDIVEIEGISTEWISNDHARTIIHSSFVGRSSDGTAFVHNKDAYEFNTESSSVYFPPNLLASRLPLLGPKLSDYSLFSIAHLEQAFGAKLGHHLNQEDAARLPAIGIGFRGEHIGIIGPLFIFALLIYLAQYLAVFFGALSRSSHQELFAPTWIGIMPSPFARLSVLITMVGLPGSAVGLSLYRFSVPHLGSFSLGMFAAGLGLLCFSLSGRCTRSFTELSEGGESK